MQRISRFIVSKPKRLIVFLHINWGKAIVVHQLPVDTGLLRFVCLSYVSRECSPFYLSMADFPDLGYPYFPHLEQLYRAPLVWCIRILLERNFIDEILHIGDFPLCYPEAAMYSASLFRAELMLTAPSLQIIERPLVVYFQSSGRDNVIKSNTLILMIMTCCADDGWTSLCSHMFCRHEIMPLLQSI